MLKSRPNGGLINISMHEKTKKVIELPCINPSTCNHHGVLNRRTSCILYVNSKWMGGNKKKRKDKGKKRKWEVKFEELGDRGAIVIQNLKLQFVVIRLAVQCHKI